MHMTFWFGYNLDGFFFSSINLTTVTGLVVSCVVLFVLALVYESLKLCSTGLRFKMGLLRRRRGHRCLPLPQQQQPNGSSDRLELSAMPLVASTKKTRCMWLMLETLVYTVEVVVGYVLMLGVMYYNATLFIVVVAGLTVGYALLGPVMVSLRIKTSRLKSKCASCSDNGSTPPTATTREGSQRGSSSLCESTPETPHEMQCCPPPHQQDSPQTSSTTISNVPHFQNGNAIN